MSRREVVDDLNAVGEAVSWADRIASEAGASHRLRHDLQLCIEEALANLIMHGRAAGAKDIALDMTASNATVLARVSDACEPFDITTRSDQGFHKDRPGGAGLRLLREFATDISYESAGGRNTLTILIAEPRPALSDAGILSVIRRIPTFAALPEPALLSLLESSKDGHYEAGGKLIAQGDASAFAIVLVSGEVSVVNESAHGAFPVAQIRAPALIGEIGALAGLPRTAAVVATSPVRTIEIGRAPLLEAFRHAPDVLISVISQLGQQVKNLNGALGMYASGFAALERGDMDEALKEDLVHPGVELANFAAAFERLANRIALERRTRVDMASAALIQRQMLPNLGALEGPEQCSIWGDMKPARQVGGDFYDVLTLDDGRIALCVGDVCGKGVSASLFMSVTVTMLRLAARQGQSLEDTIEHVNNSLCEQNPASMFATLFYGVLDATTGDFEYVNCGHVACAHLPADAPAAWLASAGPPLGIVPRRRWRSERIKLGRGETLFMYSDGVTEAVNAAGAEYGEQALEEALERLRGADAHSLVEGVIADVEAFAVEVEQFDDITCLAVVGR